jgi:hypothetical protein
MLHLLHRAHLLVFFSLLFLLSNAQESTSVKLTNIKGKTIPFKIKTKRIEWVNGKLNLSFLSTDGKLMQVNHIDAKYICDTTFRSSAVKGLLITDSITFSQLSRIAPLVQVSCKEAKKGAPITITAQGRLYYKKISYHYTVLFTGLLPEKQATSVNKQKNQ